jgi:carbamoyltransferase
VSTNIIGLNLSHDSSACLLVDGVVRGALALERTTRVKRGVVPLHIFPSQMLALVDDLLVDAGLRFEEVNHWIASSTEVDDADDEKRLTDLLGLPVPKERVLVLPHPGHHLSHASAAFYSSGFEAAVAVVADSYGSRVGKGRERESIFSFRHSEKPKLLLQYRHEDHRIVGSSDKRLRIPGRVSGIGELYRLVTLALGFRENGSKYDDAGKTMGLAAYGKRLSDDDLFMRICGDELNFDHAISSFIELGLATEEDGAIWLTSRPPGARLTSFHRNLAAQVQSEFENASLHLIRRAIEVSGERSVVLSGGCFLNSVLNTRVKRELEVERLFVFPAATDDGNAVGAALYAHHAILGRSGDNERPAPAIRHVFWGPSRLCGKNLDKLASDWKVRTCKHKDENVAAKAAATAISNGEIVGWYQERAEFGPRALGSRSILCHPGIAGMKDRLNARVKFRESFRPFASSVLAEHAKSWFAIPDEDSPFMLMVYPVKEEKAASVSEIVHADGTCRVQTVARDLAGPFRHLIETFQELTEIPMVLNTSLNLRGMPIVEYPEDAIECLFGSRLDRLFIGQYEMISPAFEAMVPVRNDFELTVSTRCAANTSLLASIEGSAARLKVAGRAPLLLEGAKFRFLAKVNGSSSVEKLADQVGISSAEAIDIALDLRLHGLIFWQGLPSRNGARWLSPQYSPDIDEVLG